jgi:hypothetical protein
MVKRTVLFLAGVALLGVSPAQSSEIASRRFLIGTWHCTFTVGNEGGSYSTTWSTVLGGLWLRQTYDQPKQARASAFKADYLVGYDPDRRGWVRFGAMTTGQYFTIRMVDTGNGGWGWTYVSLFGGRRSTPRPDYDARFVRRNDALYTIDGPTYENESHVTVTEHHVCHKIVILPRPIS